MEKICEVTQKNGEFVCVLHKKYSAVYGLGEKFDSVNQKGNKVRVCVREKCFYQGEYTYLSMPFFLTPDGFGVYVDTYVEAVFDFTKDDEITITFSADSFGKCANVYLFEGTPKDIITAFRKKTGMPRLFPKWVLGAWMSANRWRTQQEVEEQLELAEKYNFPHNVAVIEPWSDLTTHYLFNGCTIPHKAGDEYAEASEVDCSKSKEWRDPVGMIGKFHNAGVRVLLWVVPMYAQGVNIEGDCNLEQLYSDNDYVKQTKECVLNADGTPYEIPHTWCIESMVPDFTDEKGKEHWFNRFRYLKDFGIDGFKTDGGEFIHDKTVKFADGTTGIEGQNKYCESYTQAFAEFMGKDGIVFSRAGGTKSPCFSVIWAGDQESTWSEFRSVIKAGISAGLCGVNCWGFDIAGFAGYLPTSELYLRAVQTAAFVPVMQWHSEPVANGRCDFTGAWKRNDRSPWNIAAFHKDEDLLRLTRRFFRLHYNLMPYIYAEEREAAETGVSPIRHLALEFPQEKEAYNIEDEFMLGNALLVAPITEDYISSRGVFLPEGKWRGLFDGKEYDGGKSYDVAFTKEDFPVFMRENTCVPLNLKNGKLCSDVGNVLDKYEELTFLVSGKGSYRFRDDLGNDFTVNWTENDFSVTGGKIEVRCVHIENGIEAER